MENKHFGHVHNLSAHQIPEGSLICCSGCKLQVSGTIYACWPCSFFLHEQCFNASRFMQHSSHPAHPLNLVPYPTYPSNSFFCDSCKLNGSGYAYSCSLCEFDLHVHCAYNSHNNPHEDAKIPQTYPTQADESAPKYHAPNDSSDAKKSMPNLNPQSGASSNHGQTKTGEIRHFSHSHGLHLSQMREQDVILCSGCDEIISGSGYSCKEFPCTFNLHKTCFNLPREIRHKAHPNHPLTLILSSPEYKFRFACDACLKHCFGFTYMCSTCDYHLHVDCASFPVAVNSFRHCHPLSLYYNSPFNKGGEEFDGVFRCNMCFDIVPDAAWVYYCRKCDYGAHCNCLRF